MRVLKCLAQEHKTKAPARVEPKPLEQQSNPILINSGLPNCGNWPERKLMFAFFRAISVILGDKWKAMKQEDRREYVIQAKLLADEHKRVNPDCWKRKRNSEVS